MKSNVDIPCISVSLCLSYSRAGRLAHSCHIPHSASRYLLPNAVAGLLQLSAEFSTCFMSLPSRKEMADISGCGWVSKNPKNPHGILIGMSNLRTHLDCITVGYYTISAGFSSFRELHFLSSEEICWGNSAFTFFKKKFVDYFFPSLFPVCSFPYAAGKALEMNW